MKLCTIAFINSIWNPLSHKVPEEKKLFQEILSDFDGDGKYDANMTVKKVPDNRCIFLEIGAKLILLE